MRRGAGPRGARLLSLPSSPRKRLTLRPGSAPVRGAHDVLDRDPALRARALDPGEVSLSLPDAQVEDEYADVLDQEEDVYQWLSSDSQGALDYTNAILQLANSIEELRVENELLKTRLDVLEAVTGQP